MGSTEGDLHCASHLYLMGSGSRGRTSIGYDVKAHSLMGQHAHPTTTKNSAETTISNQAVAQYGKYLATVVKTAETQRPSAIGEFKSVVLQSRKADRGGDGEGGGEVEEGDDGNGGRDDGPKDEPGGTSPTGQGV